MIDFLVIIISLLIIVVLLSVVSVKYFSNKQEALIELIKKQYPNFSIMDNVEVEGFPNKGNGKTYANVVFVPNNIFLLLHSKMFNFELKNVMYRINNLTKDETKFENVNPLHLVSNEILAYDNLMYIHFPNRNGFRLLNAKEEYSFLENLIKYIPNYNAN